MITIYFSNNNTISFPKATKKDFDLLRDFMGNDKIKNYVVMNDNDGTIIPKDKILFISYKEEENER